MEKIIEIINWIKSGPSNVQTVVYGYGRRPYKTASTCTHSRAMAV